MGEQNAQLREFVGTTLNLPTPEQAAAAEKEVFASRYGRDRTRTTRDSDRCGLPVFRKGVSDEYREADW
ncbi:hypothetical protein BZL30_4244 [Mycobacterium kansasii]|uniref:Uncharacterized protein n=1 Tax=Mycobacterium kansasii TaxID=1768 RepID=A0A1V3XAU6_MYCKA|nr:hypothetical protein BZL30_4244 [Mycobacterium kansasii]